MPLGTLKNCFDLDKPKHWSHLSLDERRRQEALLEFLQTEVNYYARLTTIHEIYYSPSHKFINSELKSLIFQNLDELLLRSGLFVSDMKALQWQGQGIINSLVPLFNEHLPHFGCFEIYCKGHRRASITLQSTIKSNSKFAKFLDETVHDPRSCNLDLATLLLEPVQRLARYPLLFKQVLHHTPKDHTDSSPVLQAVMDSERLLNQVNEAVRRYESQLRLDQIQRNLRITPENDFDVGLELVGHTRQGFTRTLLLETLLWKCKSKRPLVGLLLTDMIVLLEKVRGGVGSGGEEEEKQQFRLYHEPLAIEETHLAKINFKIDKLKLAQGLNSNRP